MNQRPRSRSLTLSSLHARLIDIVVVDSRGATYNLGLMSPARAAIDWDLDYLLASNWKDFEPEEHSFSCADESAGQEYPSPVSPPVGVSSGTDGSEIQAPTDPPPLFSSSEHSSSDLTAILAEMSVLPSASSVEAITAMSHNWLNLSNTPLPLNDPAFQPNINLSAPQFSLTRHPSMESLVPNTPTASEKLNLTDVKPDDKDIGAKLAKTLHRQNKDGSPRSMVRNKSMTPREHKRQQMHNASASRSRLRLNETLEKLWRTIPLAHQRKGPKFDSTASPSADADEDRKILAERLGRADKVEIGISYIVHLQNQVKELEAQLKINGGRSKS